jgi:hypothetical protein
MFGVGIVELLIMLLVGVVSFGVPIATLVLVYMIYRNTRK